MTSSSLGVRRDTILVGNRVQSRLATGKGMSVKLCNSEDFPTDWSPTMTSCQDKSQLLFFRGYENRARRTSGRDPISVSAPQLRSSSMASKRCWVCSLWNGSSLKRVFEAIVELIVSAAAQSILAQLVIWEGVRSIWRDLKKIRLD